jgi:hypothetical protein
MFERAVHWGTEFEGSTRAVGLLRIILAVLIWVRWGSEVALFSADTHAHVVLALVFFPLTLMMFAGIYSRVTVPLVALMLFVMVFAFGKESWTHHHPYLLFASTMLLALTPCGRSYSVDRVIAVQRAERSGQSAPAEWGPLWGQRLMGLQASALYFWTAVDKTNWAFLSGERLEQAMTWVHAGGPLADMILNPTLLMLAAIAVLIVEYGLAVAIQIPRLQVIALPIGAALHLAFYVFLPVGTFSANMIALYLALIPPQRVHDFMDQLHGYRPRHAA